MQGIFSKRVSEEIDRKLQAIKAELLGLGLSEQQVSDEMHDAVDRVTGNIDFLWRSA